MCTIENGEISHLSNSFVQSILSFKAIVNLFSYAKKDLNPLWKESLDYPKQRKLLLFKDTYREKAPSNKNPTLSKSMNMDIWLFGTSNQLLIRRS